MSKLEELAKNDLEWRRIAFNICKDKNLADELVQEMYLRIHRYNITKKIDKYYVAVMLKNLFLSNCKKGKHISLDDFHYLEDETESKEDRLSDEDVKTLDVIDYLLKTNKIKWYQIELINENITKSFRDIEREFGINYVFAYRKIKEAKELILNTNINEQTKERKARELAKSNERSKTDKLYGEALVEIQAKTKRIPEAIRERIQHLG